MSPHFFLPFPSESLHLTRSFMAAETKQRFRFIPFVSTWFTQNIGKNPMRKVFIRLKFRHKRPKNQKKL